MLTQNYSECIDLSAIDCFPCDLPSETADFEDFKLSLCSGDYVVVYDCVKDTLDVEIVDRVLRTQIVLCNTHRFSIATGRCLTQKNKYLIEPTPELIHELTTIIERNKLVKAVSHITYSDLPIDALCDILDIVRPHFFTHVK